MPLRRCDRRRGHLVGHRLVGGHPATLVATTGAIDEIPLTAECSVTESTLAAPSASDASFRWLDPVYTGIASVSATPSENLLSVGNELTRETGSVVVEKTLSGETDGFTGDEDFAGFPIGIVCALDPADLGNADAEHRRTGEATVLPGAGTATLIADVPQGWTCAVSEGVFTGGLHDDSYAWSGHTIEIDGDQATGLTIGEGAHEVTVDNEITRVTGTIEITKHIDSAFDGVVDDDAQFTGAFTCVYAEGTDREETFSGTWTVSGTGAATLTGDTVLPLGTSCAVTETAPDDADLVDASWTWTDAVVDADPATVTAGAPASFAVTNTPERVFSSLAIAKALEGPSEGFADAGLTVSGDWTCVYGGETVAFGRWTAPAAGGAATLDPAAPQIPVTADCSVTEDTLRDGVFVDGSYAWGAHPETQSVEIEAGETASVTVTNTVVRVFGSFSITKAVERGEGVSEQVPASAIEYSGTYVCEYDGVQTEPLPWSITGEGTFLAPDDHYVDTDCWVAGEDQPAAPHPDDDSYQWVGVQIGDPVTIEAAPAVANTTVTNTVARLTGSFSVTKAFEGDSSGLVDETPEYGFEWQCVAADGDVFPAAGDGEFSIAAGGVWSPAVEIPVGSDCVVTEVGLPEVNDPSYTWETEMSIAGAEGTDDGASIAFEIPADAEASVLVTATNTLSREIGSYAIAKTADPISGSTVEPGDVITYTVTVTPGQIGFVDDVVVVDDLGQVVPFATLDEDSLIASAGSAAVSGDALVWTIGRVSAGTPLTLTYAVTVDPGQWGVELRNSVTTTGENPPSECPDCTTEHYTPAWEISKTADPDSGSAVVAGDVITYTLTAANTTEKATVSGATATDDLSGVIGFAELGALPDGLTRDGDVLTWAIPVMEPGDTASVSYAVTVREGFDGVTIRNGVEPGDGGECVEDCATVHHTPRWTLSKSSDPASGSVVLPGGEVTYTLTIVNEGEVPVAGAVAIDDLSGVLAHAELVGELPDGLELSGETLTWTPGTIAVGATVSVSYTIAVDEDARGVTLRNVVVPEGPGGECTEDCATSHPVPAWTIAKSSTPGSGSTVERGQTVTYTLTAVNVGDGTLSGALGIDDLSDVLAQATLTGALHPTLSLSGETLTWTIPDLAPGETATVSYAVTINADAEPAPITNVVVPAGAPGGECAESCTTTHNVPGILEGSDSGGPGFLGVTGADVPWAIGGAAVAALLAGILLIAFGRSRREKERQAV
ncbi:DUF5979 domain-containing protein [Microbacterium sp. NIBRBAC000506063]|uniref:DUF7927 domain-containing protein n=1 Tax=Microbacterium sp. NIBRBAC000506063 TaxID=2734618 RepID=UPI001BB6D8FC|nr:DUF5979 domain-containing protein [Microbacterium sp. NIBRBAC000506063]QTV79201.1 isopeptide-forming domain-containing fimbrial protein [Microbacterium sp. NIBRBAC000506063]